ncbi:hypothetical protein F4818DRAFT_446046 [Hypoxylon cercidicola]|nr:hypothetical protein F4818DRAFT_446046 [Hypoxylon cercidicola]
MPTEETKTAVRTLHWNRAADRATGLTQVPVLGYVKIQSLMRNNSGSLLHPAGSRKHKPASTTAPAGSGFKAMAPPPPIMTPKNRHLLKNSEPRATRITWIVVDWQLKLLGSSSTWVTRITPSTKQPSWIQRSYLKKFAYGTDDSSNRAWKPSPALRRSSSVEAGYLVDQQSTKDVVDLHCLMVRDGVNNILDRAWKWWNGLGEECARMAKGYTVVTPRASGGTERTQLDFKPRYDSFRR